MNILVIRFSSLGDIVLTTPVLRLVKEKYPDARLYYLTKKSFASVLEDNPSIDRVLLWEEARKDKAHILWTQEYDYLLDLHSSLRSFLVRRRLKYQKKGVFHKPYWKRFLLVKFKKNTYKKSTSVVFRYMRTLEVMGIHPHYRAPFVSPLRPMAQRLDGWSQNGETLAVAPGSRWFTKKWPAEYFEKFILDYIYRYPQSSVILLGGPDEVGECAAIHSHVRKKAGNKKQIYNFAGKLTIRETAYFLKYSGTFLTNDSGLMHIASAFPVRILALFLSTVPEFGFLPFTKNKKILSVDLPCKPCDHKGLRRCPEKHFQCAYRILPGTVMEELERWEPLSK